jgi:hypothetical protein
MAAASPFQDWSAAIKAGNLETGIGGSVLGSTPLWDRIMDFFSSSRAGNIPRNLGLTGIGSGFTSALKWGVVGLIALAAIVVIPRLLPRN